jgi:hypothetical protein
MLVAAPSCRTDDWVTLVAISIAEHSETVALIVAALYGSGHECCSPHSPVRTKEPNSRRRRAPHDSR